MLSYGILVSLSFLKVHNLSIYPDIQLHFETEEDDERELSFQLEGREKALMSALSGNKLFLCWRHQKTESANGPPLLFLVQESLMVNWAVVEKRLEGLGLPLAEETHEDISGFVTEAQTCFMNRGLFTAFPSAPNKAPNQSLMLTFGQWVKGVYHELKDAVPHETVVEGG